MAPGNHEQPSVDRTRELYDTYGFGDFCYGHRRETHNRPLVQFLRTIDPKARVFDIGCGTGYWLETAVRSGVPQANLIALDLSVRNAAALSRAGFRSVCGNVLCLPFADNVADATICCGVIHVTPDPLAGFRELVRITKPGGTIFLAVYNRWNPYFLLVRQVLAPVRYAYWNWSKRTVDVVYPVAAVFFQPLAYLFTGAFLDRKTGMTMFMDQVIVPHAHTFTRSALRRHAETCGCTILEFSFSGAYMMHTAMLVKGGQEVR